MRPITASEPRFPVSGRALCADAMPATALARSALQQTRAAIARWSGKALPDGALVREVPRISPQARWVAEAQYGLADWIARGGFAQVDDSAAPLPAPLMYQLPTQSVATSSSACID